MLPGNGLRTVLCVVLALGITANSEGGESHHKSQEVRVGVVVYETIGDEISSYKGLLKWLSKRSPVEFVAVPGTYGEVRHWYHTGQIDAAIATPVVFAAIRADTERFGMTTEALYVASRVKAPPHSALAYPDDSSASLGGGEAAWYRSRLITNRVGAPRDIKEIAALAAQDKLRVLLSDELSTSGSVVPEIALTAERIELAPGAVVRCTDHQSVVAKIAESPRGDDGVVTVGFVYERTAITEAQAHEIHAVDFPALAERFIPEDVLIASSDQVRTLLLQALAKQNDMTSQGFAVIETHAQAHAEIQDWLRSQGIEFAISQPRMSIDRMIDDLVFYQDIRGKDRPLRLAVVLPGGGVRAVYQLGVVRELERRLHAAGLDIHLVAGTSGGSITAPIVASGKLTDDRFALEAATLFETFGARSVFDTGLALELWSGATIAAWVVAVSYLVLAAMVTVAAVWRSIQRPQRPSNGIRLRRATWVLGLSRVCCLVGVTALLINPPASATFGWFFSGGAIAFLLIVASIVTCLITFRCVRRWRTHPTVIMAITGASVAVAVGSTFMWGRQALFVGNSLFERASIESVVADGYRELFRGSHAEGRRYPPPVKSPRFPAAILKRDLIVTASVLSNGEGEPLRPNDIYFYYDAPGGPAPAFSPESVDLSRTNAPPLVRAIAASSSIFPIFPAIQMATPNDPGQLRSFIDGGFIHLSPVEAATEWGATHVIIIEASPPEIRASDGLWENLLAMGTYLHDSAQLADARAFQNAAVYRIAPSVTPNEYVGVLERDPSGIRAAYRLGRSDALRGARQSDGRPDVAKGDLPFQKFFGPPAISAGSSGYAEAAIGAEVHPDPR
ncbi:MAG: patatin-like phospholipase family protein [Phycisphaerales bacterium]